MNQLVLSLHLGPVLQEHIHHFDEARLGRHVERSLAVFVRIMHVAATF